MGTLLVENAVVLVTMDEQRTEIPGGGLFARDGWIEQVGDPADLPSEADEVVDASGHVVTPGLVNTHHHLYQTLTRAVPAAQDAGLFAWLQTLYPIWARMKSHHIDLSTRVGLAELALSGCTTTADHLYLFPNDCTLDDEIHAAADVGLRLHASRGSMSLGESEGGLPPDAVVEPAAVILDDTARVAETFHDPRPGAMTRIVAAPCSPFSVTPELMRETAEQARALGLTMHTHLAETLDEERFCLESFGKTPMAYAEDLGWMGPEVWFAHGVHPTADGIRAMAVSGTGVAHCPSSNMRLASGIAPLEEYLRAGVRIGLGVDGSASNDGSHMLGEARQAMLLARLAASEPIRGNEGDLLSARHALELATRGGAAVLGRDDIGSLEAGKAADFVGVAVDRLEFAGALADPVAALVLCAPVRVDLNYVHGKPVVRNGELQAVDVDRLIHEHNAAARELLS